MKRQITKALILFGWLPLAAQAQTSPDLTRNFSANIITRIYEVNSRVKLPPEKQMLLGKYFKMQDSLANAAIARGATPAELNKYYKIQIEDLGKILSPFELNDYSINKDNTASKFAVAIKYREQLNLDKSQLDSLFAQSNISKSFRKKAGIDIKKYEADHLTHILKNNQYRALLLIVNKEKALTFATNAWQELKQMGLTNGLDSLREFTAFCNYQNNKITSVEYNNTTGDVDKNELSVIKPLLAKKLDVVAGNTNEKELSAALKYHNELQLDQKQLNEIVNYALQLEVWVSSIKAKNENLKPDTRKNEIKQLLTILKNKDKYLDFLEVKNKDKAVKNAQVDWVDLKKFDLAKNLDSAQTYMLSLKYETKLLVDVEQIENEGNAEKADSVKKVIGATRPQILLKLAAYKKTLPKSQFADVITLRKELVLSDDQIDQFLEKSSKLEFLKLDNKAHGIYEFTKAKEFEGANLIAILNEVQYSHSLFYKVGDKGHENAKNDWEKLKKFGLTRGLDSAKVSLETLNYETNMLVALERIKNDNSQKNLFLKKDQENRKPVYLKQLDVQVKNLAANDDAKKSLAW